MKKIVLICCVICLSLCCLGYGIYYFAVSRPHQSYVNEIISKLGGEGEIKKYCMEQRTGPIEMESGERLPRYLGLQDIERINKMCDCVVGKAYKTFGDPEIMDKLKTVHWTEDMAEFLKYALMTQYMICEMEVQEILNKKYKSVDI